ncbi:hypothetical protein LCGC14_2287610 [marine sediment metagenome]|uniref:HTH merR-type domain-containing protein n=1 Tax=marine sediment metagenome TaxID=412755 RepID=A0A0F9DEQ7_9ZZZZ
MNKMMTITEVAKTIGVSPGTIKKWEEMGKIKKAKRDQKGRRVYYYEDAERLMAFHIVKSF